MKRKCVACNAPMEDNNHHCEQSVINRIEGQRKRLSTLAEDNWKFSPTNVRLSSGLRMIDFQDH
jgi:hypothetical protein